MAPLVLIGTWISHLFGASVGREGTALQMSGSLTDGFNRLVGLDARDRRIMLVAALAGGFGAVFGVPFAGAVFGPEVQVLGRRRWTAFVPAVAASFVGDLVYRTLGGRHGAYPRLSADLSSALMIRVAVAGAACGVVGAAYPPLTRSIKRLLATWLRWPPARPFVGGMATIGLVLTFGHDYEGLSLPIIDRALDGEHLSFAVFALKLVFTAVAVGSGFFGGEVTPLFVVGASFGSALALPLGADGQLLAAVGFCAVFAAAANTPVACIALGAELFGTQVLAPVAVGCLVAYVVSGHHGIYRTERAHQAKAANAIRALRLVPRRQQP